MKTDKASSTTILSYTVPRSICSARHSMSGRSDEDTDARNPPLSLQLGAVIALADEVTSIVLGAVDKVHRFGVSVQLSGQL